MPDHDHRSYAIVPISMSHLDGIHVVYLLSRGKEIKLKIGYTKKEAIQLGKDWVDSA